MISRIIIHMKKLLDSDWLRAVRFKCNTSAKRCNSGEKVQHQCKLHIVILDYDLHKDNEKFCRPMISSCKAMTKILYRNSEKSLLERDKNCFKEHPSALFPCDFFHVFISSIGNHTVSSSIWN